MARIVILGGGFGGLAAAHELRKLLPEEHAITLIDRRDHWFVGFAKVWDMVGLRPLEEGRGDLTVLNGKGIEFLEAEITAIDPQARTVETSRGTVSGDFMLVALGTAYDADRVANFPQAGYNLYDAAALPAIRHGLEQAEEGRVVIAILGLPYKCPPAPYEAAFMIEEWLHQHGRRPRVQVAVYTPQPSPLPIAGPEASRQISQTLEEREIELHTEHQAQGADPGVKVLNFTNGKETRFTVLLGVPAHLPPQVVARSPLAGQGGWIEPDPRTLETSFPGVYAVGDCTLVPIAEGKGQLPKAGVFAEAQGRVAARNIAAGITGAEGAEYDGRGYCFLEFGRGRAAYVEGDFYARPRPQVVVTAPDEKTFKAKQEFERERLKAWF